MKELRWFTRGEFRSENLKREDTPLGREDLMNTNKLLGNYSSIYSFTRHFNSAYESGIKKHPLSSVSIEGGPHTFWWSTQNIDGTWQGQEPGTSTSADVPIPQLLRQMQPNARFLLTLAEPVKRMYSDYYFLDENRMTHSQNEHPQAKAKRSAMKNRHTKGGKGKGKGKKGQKGLDANQNADVNTASASGQITHTDTYGVSKSVLGLGADTKSAIDFHKKAEHAVEQFRLCVSKESQRISSSLSVVGLSSSSSSSSSSVEVHTAEKEKREKEKEGGSVWFRASQVCAHDRATFGRAGHGRLAIGLYSLFFEKWVSLTLNFSTLLASCVIRSGALDSANILLSYSIISLA